MIDAWLTQEGKSRAWLADALGITEASLSRLANNKQTPSLELAIKIKAMTGIPVEAFAKDRAQPQAHAA
jgi:DNA-binding XRE family transcriptional regulator